MAYKDAIKKLWSEAFGDSREYVDMYFERVYQEEDALYILKDGKVESSLLLQHYGFRFHDAKLPMAYIAGAATRRASRGKGLMSDLMRTALIKARERGDMLVSLVPAHDWLYFFYDKFGLSTVFYVDPQRFTSLHIFTPQNEYYSVEDPYSDEVWEAFERLEKARGCGVVHSRRDFLNILEDIKLAKGSFVAMRDAEGSVVSMAWATVGDLLTVTELMGTSHDSREAALARLRELWPDKAFKVLSPPLVETRRLFDRGMARIVNVPLCLQTIAQAHPEWHCLIRVKDPIFAENSHTYKIADGKVVIADSSTANPDFDVDIKVFNEIVFSSAKMGEVLRFPSERPVMSLMLE